MMNKMSMNEFAALSFVLSTVTVKDLLQRAMQSYSEEDNVSSKDKANTCSQAINTFLMQYETEPKIVKNLTMQDLANSWRFSEQLKK